MTSTPVTRRAPRTTVPRPLPPRARALRLLAVIALTAGVVVAWRLMDAPRPPSPAEAGVRISRSVAPPGSTVTSDARLETARPALPELPANALPGPPDLPEPTRPDRFERFVVQRGDTLFDISVVYGVEVDEILRFNPALGDGTRIDVGQVVLVPITDE